MGCGTSRGNIRTGESSQQEQQQEAEDNEEFALGIGCLAAPVFNHELRCVAAIGVTGGIQDYCGESRETLVAMLLRTADTISQKLGRPQNS